MTDQRSDRPETARPQPEEDIKVSEAPTGQEASRQTEAPAESEDKRRGALASLADVEQEVEKAFERFFRGSWLPSFREWPAAFPALRDSFEGRTPKVDVRDRDDEVIVDAELPGVAKADIEVSLGDGSITIKASHRQESTESDENYHRREISQGVYSRTVPLPAPVDGARATAAYENGLLTVRLPKLASARAQSIEVR